jgi:hypothetical protein
VANLLDNCLLMPNHRADVDPDRDGVGNTCDVCRRRNGGQIDFDGDGQYDMCDSCPFPTSILNMDSVTRGAYWGSAPRILRVNGIESDGRWLDSEYTTYVEIGSDMPLRYGGLRASVHLPDGTYAADVHVEDGCGLSSATHSISFGVDSTAPYLVFNSPAEGATIRRDRKFTVNVAVGDLLSGIGSLKIFLDAPNDGPPDLGPQGRLLCRFPRELYTIGFVEKKSCLVSADFSRGRHTLYAVAKDRAGNETVTSRTIVVSGF